MKPNAILFVDVDDAVIPHYTYREPHFIAARQRGLTCLTAAVQSHRHAERLDADSDAVYFLEALTVAALKNLLDQLQPHYRIRAVFCHAGHTSILGQVGCVVAEVCARLNLPYSTSDAIEACNNKFLMRQALQKQGVLSVDFALCHDEIQLQKQAQRIGYPIIAKPPFGAGSAFIKKCHDWLELKQHYRSFVSGHHLATMADFYGTAHQFKTLSGDIQHYQPGQSILLEAYIDGIEGSVECVISANHIHPLLLNEKLMLTDKSGTILENLLITPPVSFSQAEKLKIQRYAAECLTAVGLNNAIVHLEFRMTKDGPVVIEINPRLGGLYVNSALQDLAGIDPYQIYLSLLLGSEDVDSLLIAAHQRAASEMQHYAMLAIYPEHSGFFQGFENLASVIHTPDILKYEVHPTNTYVDAEIEEHFLFKCWARVGGKDAAQAFHDDMVKNLRPVITSDPYKETITL